jgi:hypothetical protein
MGANNGQLARRHHHGHHHTSNSCLSVCDCFVCVQVAPICVYTSGKGSSAAGLTAAVVQDANSREFFLEVRGCLRKHARLPAYSRTHTLVHACTDVA